MMNAFTFLQGANEVENESFKTPGGKLTTALPQPTPGEVVSRLQAEILRKDRFVSALGAETVESWGFDWNMLENSSVSFEDSSRIAVMSQLYERLGKVSRKRFDDEFSSLYTSFLTLRDRIRIVHGERLETVTERYFKKIFPGSNVECDAKVGGVQLGNKAKVTLLSGEMKKYHIKTHSEGRLSERSSAAKHVNPQELMIYKILEYTGFGCESHFLQRSAEDVYIATLDASDDGNFNMFARASGHLGSGGDEVYGQSLWGNLQTIHSELIQNDWKAIETSIQSDAVSLNFLNQLSSLDMLTRILRLRDLLNNPENFGFVSKEGKYPLLKVIDFRISDENIFRVNFEHFGGFLVGNGMYRYSDSHRVMRYVLHDRSQEDRVRTALSVLTQTSLSKLHEHIDRAYQEIRGYILNTDVFADHISRLMEELDTYTQAVHHNVSFFTDKLQFWTPEDKLVW